MGERVCGELLCCSHQTQFTGVVPTGVASDTRTLRVVNVEIVVVAVVTRLTSSDAYARRGGVGL